MIPTSFPELPNPSWTQETCKQTTFQNPKSYREKFVNIVVIPINPFEWLSIFFVSPFTSYVTVLSVHHQEHNRGPATSIERIPIRSGGRPLQGPTLSSILRSH